MQGSMAGPGNRHHAVLPCWCPGVEESSKDGAGQANRSRIMDGLFFQHKSCDIPTSFEIIKIFILAGRLLQWTNKNGDGEKGIILERNVRRENI